MVELPGGAPDGSGVPTIAELLLAYRDRTGTSYAEMSRKVGDEITAARMHQLATRPPGQFPKTPRVVELLARLLEVPVTTIVLGFAAGLGLDVRPGSGLLAQALPPGVDDLPGHDRDAVIAVARALVRARADADASAPITGPEPATQHDYGLAARRGHSEGRRVRDQQDQDAELQ